MTKRLDGSVALVTGASSGIGEATARALADAGAGVALVARRRDRLEALAGDILNIGGRALVIDADLTDQAAARSAVDRTVQELGSLDILINNAGVMLLGPVMNAPVEEWERMVHINQLALLYTTHAALPHLLQAAENGARRVADVVNVSSVAGRSTRSGIGVYSMTKFGVVAFGESLRQEVTSRYVRVATIEPGLVATELTDHLRPEIREQSTKRFAGVEQLQSADVAEAIAYVVTRPRHMTINEVVVRPTMQDW